MLNKQLSVFIHVADCGSFSKAANDLYISNVSVMKQINALEDRFQIKLFDRTTHGVSLTPAGRLIYNDARKMSRQADMTIARAREIAKIKSQSVVRVGTSFLRSCKPLLSIWSSIDTTNLPIQIKIIPFDEDFDNPQTMFRSLGKEIDCFWGPCGFTEGNSVYQIHPFGKTPCRIAVPRKHPLAAKEKLVLDDLKGESLVLLKYGLTSTLNQIHQLIQTQYPEIHIIESPSLYNPQLLSQWTQMGYCIETLDMWSDAHPQLKTLPVDWEYASPYGIVCLREPSESTSAFIQAVIHASSN